MDKIQGRSMHWRTRHEKKAAILVVDDDPDITDALKIVLENHDFAVRTASNGKEASAAFEEQILDLMILDIMMATDTEGFDLAYDLKENPKFKNLPIIMLTSFLEKVREEGPGDFAYILGEQLYLSSSCLKGSSAP